MKILIFLSFFCFSLVLSSSLDKLRFNRFKSDFGKIYSDESEENQRYNIFLQNVRKIHSHNADSGKTWKMEINEFTDRSDEEIKTMFGRQKSPSLNIPMALEEPDIDLDELPDSVDWSAKGATTPVKKQGYCGSCWAFASVENIESYAFLANGTLPVLSPQQLTSCVKNPQECGGNGGCEGSIAELAYTYAQLFGVAEDKDYPYISGDTSDTGVCTFNPSKTPPKVALSGYERLPANSYAAVMNHLAKVGPLTVNIDASNLHTYSSGLFDGCPTDKNININHVVQLVGYGTDEILGDYWKVRNSWGPYLGEKGFIRMKRNKTPTCGTDTTPSFGTKCKNDPYVTQHVCGTCGILFDTSYPLNVYFI